MKAARCYVGLYVGHETVTIVEVDPAQRFRIKSFAQVDFNTSAVPNAPSKVTGGIGLTEPSTGFGDTQTMIGDEGAVLKEGSEVATVDEAMATAFPLARPDVVSAIRRAVEDSGIEMTNVATALSAEEVMVRYFEMPFVAKRDRDSAVLFEVKKYIPFRLDEVEYHYIVMQADRKADRMQVVFVAAKAESLEIHLQTIQAAGLTALSVEMASFSLARALHAQLDPDGATLIMEVAGSFATLSILKSGVPVFTRDIPLMAFRDHASFAGEESKLFGRTLSDAPTLHGRSVFDHVLSEVRLSLDYYEKQSDVGTIHRAVVVGDANLDTWQEMLQTELELEVQQGVPGVVDADEGYSPRLAVATGLALRARMMEPYRIDLSHQDIATGGLSQWGPLLVAVEAVVICAVLLGVNFTSVRAITAAQQRLEALHRQQPPESIALAGVPFQELKERQVEVEEKMLRLQQMVDKRVSWVAQFNVLSELLPENLWLTYMRCGLVDGKAPFVKLRGAAYADDGDAEAVLVNTYVDRLRADISLNEQYVDVRLGSLARERLSGVNITQFEVLLISEGST